MKSNILYVNLSKLAEQNNPAGELAGFLLGNIADPENEEVREIVKSFNAGFNAFKADKEAVKMMSLRERARNEGWLDGVEEGEVRGEVRGKAIGSIAAANEISELIKLGFSPEEAIQKILNKHTAQ